MIGTTLSHYKIVEKLGAGGMGEVYRAEDTTLKRHVALKFLPPEMAASEERLERFQREAETLAALDHPNIVSIYSVEEADEVRFLTMQLVEGKRLSELIPKGGMSLERIFEIAVPLTDALAAAHEKGVIHRDLKPGNIMVTDDGRVKVLDFGLAKLRAEAAPQEATELPTEPLTNEGRILGTVPYMSPEQLEGKPVDASTDIFSLGVVLFEMAIGERPFKGETQVSTMSSLIRDTPPEIDTLRTDLPHHLARVIRRCLEKKPQRRYQSAFDVRNELEDLKREVVSGEGPTPVTLPAAAPWPRGRRAVVALVVALVFIAAAIGLYVARIREPARVETGREPIRSLAVLPLTNLMNDPEQEYFVDGMTEALIAELAKMGQLKVISRTSIMRYKGTKKPLPDIAQELDVDALVEGSVLRSGDEVRITAQLIDGSTDEHLWVETYDRDLGDMLAVHREVARAIAREVNIRLTPEQHERLAPLGPVDPAAYEAYLKGRYYWNQRSETGLRKGLEYFEQAIELDPRYAPAYAGIADSYTLLAWIGAALPHEAMPKARAAARQALEIDESLAEAHTSLGMVEQVYEWDWPGAEKEHRRALELNPGYATGHSAYATLLSALGRPEVAVAERMKAQRLDPLSPILSVGLGLNLYFSGRYEEAIAEAGRALELAPAFFPAHFVIGSAHLKRGLHEQAIAALDTARSGSGGSTLTVAALAHAHAVSGQRAQAEELLEGLLERSEREYVSAYFIAWIYLGLGNHERALDWLEKAHEEHSTWFFLIKADPMLDPLRHKPRFQQLVRRMNFPA